LLYDPISFKYTPEGIELNMRVKHMLTPLISEYIEQGCSPRDITHIIIHNLMILESSIVISMTLKKGKKDDQV
jgi:hypothetical protein